MGSRNGTRSGRHRLTRQTQRAIRLHQSEGSARPRPSRWMSRVALTAAVGAALLGSGATVLHNTEAPLRLTSLSTVLDR